jgi:DNA-binding transcriptional LysR family regulator
MDLEDLRTFVDVADAGGVSSAARRLGVSKSIVSRRLFRLEAELGVQLLARTTRGAALTEAGVTFREHAARVRAEIDAALETILPAGELRGRLRIAAPLSLGPTHLAPVFAEMARRHASLYVQASYTDLFVDVIGEGFDCAIRVGYLTDSNLIARRVGPLTGTLVASPDYKETRIPRDAGRSPHPSSAYAGSGNLAIYGWRQDNFHSSAGAIQSRQRYRSRCRCGCGARHRLAPGSPHQGLSGFRGPCSGYAALPCSDGRYLRGSTSRAAPHKEGPSSHRIAD